MNAVGTLFSVLAFAWLAYAGYRLWGGTSSNTAKWIGVGLVGLMAIGLTQDLLDLRKESAVTEPSQSDTREIVLVKDDTMCMGCQTTRRDGKYVLQGTWMAGELKLEPVGPQPYALSFERGSISLDGRQLSQGCSTGELTDDATLQVAGARGLRLEIGAGARCR